MPSAPLPELAHRDLMTEKSERYVRDGLRIMNEALDSGTIRNVDFQSLKFHMGRAWDHETDSRTYLSLDEAGIGRYHPLTDTLYDLFPYALAHVGSVRKKIEAARKRNADVPERVQRHFDFALKYVERWQPVVDRMNELKPLVVKGRRVLPESERKTPPRTIDHTGSCSCCVRNVKLDGKDHIVDHGFEIGYGQRNGHCFGVDFPPVEISPEGIVAYADHIHGELERVQAYKAKLDKGDHVLIDPYRVFTQRGNKKSLEELTFRPGGTGYAAALAHCKGNAAGEIGMLERIEADARKRIASWKPAPLPDGRREHLATLEAMPDPETGLPGSAP